ncbi:GNAT family N-acetyltransferase [Jannaschia formosa]|uniref:GNAT family N-acetyltransferase n=1 Tax=Jannaschia formosa TaxID=2259592 RepID=UPI000E1BF692|nr:GNAT family N-acetyltransferase [Jannaschia formosa]TFL16344.1 GNAT family N-acetyltransferase [Jannaschia formosa]
MNTMNTHILSARAGACARSATDAEVSISRARIEDAPALRALHQLSLVTLSDGTYSPEQIHGLFATRDTAPLEMLAPGRMHVALRHGFIVGSAGWEPRPIEGQPGAHLRSVFVHPLQTRQGIASMLVRAVEADAMAQCACRFTLAATLNAVPLYRRLGYDVVAPGRLDLGGGLAFPVVHMARSTAMDQQGGTCELIDTEGR